jgi:putative hydrolase of the HAD superfamily
MPIRGLIFDFGGVLMNMRWDVARELEELHGLERASIARTLYDCDEWREVELGRGDIEGWRAAAHRRLEEAAGKPLPPLHQQWRASWGPIEPNLVLVRALRPPYRLAILSNADSTLEDRLRDGVGMYHWFDAVLCSATIGCAKPEARAFLLAAERLGLPPEVCVFVDDTERNVNAARELGMAAVHFRVHHNDDLAAQLGDLGVRPSALR